MDRRGKGQGALTWLKLLEEFQHRAAEKVPPEWETAKQLSARLKIKVGRVNILINSPENIGRIESKKFRINTGKKVMAIRHYRLKT